MNVEIEQWRTVIAGFAGAVFFALIHLGATLLNGQAPTRQDIIRAAINMMLAIASGTIAAVFLTDALVQAVPWASLKNPQAMSFVIGALSWVTAPFLLDVGRKWAAKKSEGMGQ